MPFSCRSFGVASAWVTIVLAFLVTPARVDAQGAVELDRYRPAPIEGDGLAVPNAVAQGHLRFGLQLSLDYAHDPLVWETRSGSRASESRHIVEHHFVAHAYGSLGLFDRLVVFAGVPMNLVQRGERTQDLAIPAADGAGVGNPVLGARVLLLPQRSSGFGLALQAEVAFPLASRLDASQSYSGDSGVTFFPQAIAHYEAGPVRVAMNLGYRIRENQTLAALDVGDELTFGLGARFRVASHSTLLAELRGSSTTTNVFGREETPIEALGGYEFRHASGVTLLAGAGAGTRGFGAPDARGVFTLRYTSPTRSRPTSEEPDSEEESEDDAIVAEAASEPTPDETTTNASDDSGVADTAPTDPTPAEPDEGSDRRATSDVAIADADGDGIADADDACPELAGIAAYSGCPHEPLYEINERIYFEYDSARLDPQSYAVLDEIARLLQAHPEVRVVRVEGHADPRGSHDYNVGLSHRRATAVTRYLVRRGVPASRIDVHGFGHTQPADGGATDADDEHARHRRVEFRIVGVE